MLPTGTVSATSRCARAMSMPRRAATIARLRSNSIASAWARVRVGARIGKSAAGVEAAEAAGQAGRAGRAGALSWARAGAAASAMARSAWG
ncbi:hypothetical protein ACFQX4_10765 [Roseomonas sp. GCM10028921]